LKNNWGANIDKAIYNGSPRFETTLSNGKTYGFINRSFNWEVVEFPASGPIRFTGKIIPGLSSILCNDGSLQDYTSGSTATLKRFVLTGFDASSNPQWSAVPQILASAATDDIIGNPITFPNSQCFSSTNKVVFFNPHATVQYGAVIMTGYHLAGMQIGSNNNYLFQTEKSTHRSYSGDYPPAGYFDCGNYVNDYAGGSVGIVDRNIVTSYHGEFWKNGQTNKFNHYYDNGLAIGQFGVSGDQINGQPAFPAMAGNALTPVIVKDNMGDLYLYHGDESHHAAFHRWKITGLNTIAEQVITIPYPSAYANGNINYVDLMFGLPFDADTG
jgi:hypothetical protein